MFLFNGGSSILVYLLSLVIVWGAVLVNGFVYSTLKREIKNQQHVKIIRKTNSRIPNTKTYFVQGQKNTHQKNTNRKICEKQNFLQCFMTRSFHEFFPNFVKDVFSSSNLLRAPPLNT